MATFHHFPKLPTELRLEIWRVYFAICHGTQMHIFLSTAEETRYLSQDATTGAEGHDTLAVAKLCADSWATFQESFYVGDRSSLPPQTRTSLTRGEDRFAIGAEDMIYIIDSEFTHILVALSFTSWFSHAQRVAFQICNFHTHPDLGVNLIVDRVNRWIRRWGFFHGPAKYNQRMLTSPSLQQLLFVVVPNEEILRTQYSKPNIYGFAFFDPISLFDPGSMEEGTVVSIQAQMYILRLDTCPDLKRKIAYVVDAVPDRAGFSVYA
ncbi:hypothetical protein E0Z10_g6564 [Xylaria hypoxylon]|uniref:2EXR domain-containing protein n=1 Tax=Xylaria hypoxylon TaxID=37992 RepID=A0A4Z0YQ96_9PEZI|nr:hypothetical protein E0Z10_g6564 [Xylaria hypoxylon]